MFYDLPLFFGAGATPIGMELFFRRYGEGPPLVILHGLFGSGGNWHTLSSKRFGAHFTTYAVDLPNHGSSPHADSFDYPSMASEVAGFLRDRDIAPASILGHSMGGKVAMFLAIEQPDLVDRLIVADMSPRSADAGHEHIIRALQSVNLEAVESRSDADDALATKIGSKPVRQFLLTNLRRRDDGSYEWQMNLDVIARDYPNTLAPTPDGTFDGPTLFIRGTESGYIGADDEQAIFGRFPNATIVDIQGAGHWVHAERPDEFGDAVLRFAVEPDPTVARR